MPWPCEDCSGTGASRLLFDIIEKAYHEAPNIPDPYRTQIITLALDCSKHDTNITDDMGNVLVDQATHCQHLIGAWNALTANPAAPDWAACVNELEHGLGGGSSGAQMYWLDFSMRQLDKELAKNEAAWKKLKDLLKKRWPDLPPIPDPPADSWHSPNA